MYDHLIKPWWWYDGADEQSRRRDRYDDDDDENDRYKNNRDYAEWEAYKQEQERIYEVCSFCL
jgi:hypothetical protein